MKHLLFSIGLAAMAMLVVTLKGNEISTNFSIRSYFFWRFYRAYGLARTGLRRYKRNCTGGTITSGAVAKGMSGGKQAASQKEGYADKSIGGKIVQL